MASDGGLWQKFDALAERYKEGKRILKDLQEQFDELAECEKAYGKSLSKTAKASLTPGKQDPSSLGESLQQWRAKVDAMGKAHQDIATALASESKGLAALADAQSKAKKTVEADLAKMRGDIDRIAAEVPKAYKNYMKASREAEEALLAAEQAQWFHQPDAVVTKLSNLHQQKKKAAQQAEDAYKALLDEGRDNSRRGSNLRNILQTYERLYQERVQFLRDVVTRISGVHATAINSVYDANNAVLASVDAIQAQSGAFDTLSAELQQFETRDNADDSRFLYIPYADQLDHRPPPDEPVRAAPPPIPEQVVREEPLDLTFAPKITGPIYTSGQQMQPSLASTSDAALLRFMQQQGVAPRKEDTMNPDLQFAPKLTGPIYTSQSDMGGSQRSLASTTDAALLKFMQQQQQQGGRPSSPAAHAPAPRQPQYGGPPQAPARSLSPGAASNFPAKPPPAYDEWDADYAAPSVPTPPPRGGASGAGGAPAPPPRGQSRR